MIGPECNHVYCQGPTYLQFDSLPNEKNFRLVQIESKLQTTK